MSTTTSLRDRRIVVTGAGGALGRQTAAVLTGRGARVVGLDLAAGPGVLACDVRDSAQVVAAVAQARTQLDGIDALIHFAGIGLPSSAGTAPDGAVLATLDINLVGAWRVTAACIEDVVAARGRVIFVSSELAYATIPLAAAYTVSKRGLSAYADSLRAEYASHVGVTTVYPGYVRTSIHDASVAAGLGLEGSVRPQRAEQVVDTVIGALVSRRVSRDVACSALGRFELAAARHLPAVVDLAIRRRLRREVRRGRYLAAPLAAGMRSRMGFPDPDSTLEEATA
jgi:NAD(P)-dependent dehydrogenase (short-subunit alcohol dehydrogenase family)